MLLVRLSVLNQADPIVSCLEAEPNTIPANASAPNKKNNNLLNQTQKQLAVCVTYNIDCPAAGVDFDMLVNSHTGDSKTCIFMYTGTHTWSS